MGQVIGVPRETFAGEKRVATVPEVVEKLVKLGFQVSVQSGAGDAANFADDTYRAAGAQVAPDAAALWSGADIVFKVRAPSFINLGVLSQLVIGHKVADAVVILGSFDIVMGEVDR